MSVLSESGYQFKNFKYQYISDIADGVLTFRLIFDVKEHSVLTYIYVLEGEDFLENGLSHFGYVLNSFDLTGYTINQNFGFNNLTEFSRYAEKMISIFEDFREEFVKRYNVNTCN